MKLSEATLSRKLEYSIAGRKGNEAYLFLA